MKFQQLQEEALKSRSRNLFFFPPQRTKIPESIELHFLVVKIIGYFIAKSGLPPCGGLHSPRVWAVCASQTMSTLCRTRRGSILHLEEESSSQSSLRGQQVRRDEEWLTYPGHEGVIYTLPPGAPPSEVRRSTCPYTRQTQTNPTVQHRHPNQIMSHLKWFNAEEWQSGAKKAETSHLLNCKGGAGAH